MTHPLPADVPEQQTHVTNPWTAIWTRPREAVRAAIEQDRRTEVYLLAALGGILYSFDNISEMNLGDTTGLPGILALWVLLGTLGGLFSLLITPGVLTWTGRWFGGRASLRKVQHAYAWAYVPSLPAFGVVLLQIAVWGRSVFTTEGPAFEDSLTEAALLLGLIGVAFALFVWSMITFFRALSEVQGFSVWKALGSAAVPLLVLVAIGLGAAFLVG